MSPSTSNRPLMLRARPDVVAAAVRVAGSPRWVVSDPVTLAHYDLSEQEYTLLSAMREGTSLRDLQRAFEARFAPRRISLDEVWEFVSRLHRAGLAVATGAGQGAELHEKQRKQRHEQAAWAWTRVLAIKLPGINPEWLLGVLYPMVRCVFTLPFLLLAVGVMLFGASIVLTDYSAFVAGMPGLEELASPRSIAALVITAIAVKVLHELGHALACKHFGGQVAEMGVLLLAFTPAMYCDVTDMWRLPSKAKRMTVSAAGILVELLLAAVAAIVWRYSDPGLLHTAALNVMIVCTVGTLLVNANPLLRYDGYYVLSDLTETPNLWQRSRDAVSTLWTDWFSHRGRERSPIKPWWLPIYGLASQCYMVVVVGSIIWMLIVTLRPCRLEALAYAVGAIAVSGVLSGPARKLVRWARNPMAHRRLRRGRAAVGAAIALLLLVGVWRIPIRYSVEGEASVTLAESELVVTTVAGRLVEVKPAGATMKQGDSVARLENPDVTRELVELRNRLQGEQLRVKQFKALRARDKKANDELPAAEASVADLQMQLASLEDEADRLTLRAECDGVVIRPERLPAPSRNGVTLARWSGSPLDPENLGAWLETGVEVCRVGDPSDLCAQVVLTEDDIERVRIGQRVKLSWLQTPGVVSEGQVMEVSQRAVRAHDAQRSSDATVGPSYIASVELKNPSPQLRLDGEGRAKIDTGGTSLGTLVVTRMRQWFKLP